MKNNDDEENIDWDRILESRIKLKDWIGTLLYIICMCYLIYQLFQHNINVAAKICFNAV